MSEVLIWYLIKYRPYDNILDNCIEIVNEVTIALIFLFSQGLIHDLPDSFDRENLGNMMISIIALCMIFNVYFFIQNMYRTLIVATCVPLCKKLRDRLKARAKVEEIDQISSVEGKGAEEEVKVKEKGGS